MSSLSSRQIGGVEVSKSSDSACFRIKYFVVESELDSYIPQIGDDAPWAPEAACVSAYSKSWYGPGCWIVSISACPSSSSSMSVVLNSDSSFSSFVSKSYSVHDLFFPIDWWGARFATPDECPGFNSQSSLGPSLRRYLDADGNWCRPGSALYNNGIPYETDELGQKIESPAANKGSPDFLRSPFKNATIASMPLSLAGQTVKTKVYSCDFYTKRLPQNISDFAGVSGSFSGNCRPAKGIAGKWKALSQSIENIRASNGSEWTRVSRSMLFAPLELAWDPEKNGGTWTW